MWEIKSRTEAKSNDSAGHEFPSAVQYMNYLTPRAARILELARKEAVRFNHNFVGTEHVLLGLLELGSGVAVNVLQNQGLHTDVVRKEIEKQIGAGPEQHIIGHIPFTPRVMKVIELAAKEAKALSHTYIGTEHILLGLLRENEGAASRVLTILGLNSAKTRIEVLKELDPNFKP
jgi:ATP-dependent Clp protease ATP-binding subunit ClpC